MREKPTEKQIILANKLGLTTRGRSKRVLSAMIQDELEEKSIKDSKKKGILPGTKVCFVDQGESSDEPTVSSIGKNGRIYFRNPESLKYRSAWSTDLKIIKS